MVVAIKRESGIENRLDESRDKGTSIDTSVFTGLLEDFETFMHDFHEFRTILSAVYSKFDPLGSALQPQEINAFLQAAAEQYRADDRFADAIGIFLTSLIYKSHVLGNKQFTLDTSVAIGHLMWHLPFSQQDNPAVSLIYNGDVGKDLGRLSENCHYLVTGNAGMETMVGAKNCMLELHGSFVGGVGASSENCEYILHEVADPIWGDMPFFASEAKKCSYKTTNEELRDILVRDIPKGNRVYFIEDGEEELLRDFNA